MIMVAPSEIQNSKSGAHNTVWSEEFERLPLKHRLKLLLASNRLPLDSDVKSDKILKNCFLGEFNHGKNSENRWLNSSHITASAASERAGLAESSSFQESLVVENPVEVKIECGEDSETKMSVEVLDKLDRVVFKERLRMLLTSEYLELPSPVLEAFHNISGDSRIEQTLDIPSFPNVKVEPPNLDEFQSSNVTFVGQISSRNFVLEKTKIQTAGGAHEDDLDHMLLSGRSELLSSRDGHSLNTDQSSKLMSKMGHPALSCSPVRSKPAPSRRINRPKKILLSGDSRIEQTPDLPSFANVKVEPPNLDEFQSSNELGQTSLRNFVLVKSEDQTAGDADDDYLDHMLLSERMKLLPLRDGPSLNTDQSSEFMSKSSSASSYRPGHSKPAPSLKINRPRKRRKTVTDSVETAMEEDAPGLLKVLIEKGVSVDEIKLYGEPESNDALDDSSTNDNFGELEEVMTKLFSERESFLKYAPVRCSRGERASYCLECLFSLVEQARYLKFRHWPVEWGWCRDLQSFIFVFERHNRIVLERPEYGYATYFFELIDSLPIQWQVKRLVTAMKLTSCSRITLIENKALMVGDDLSEGEARVLMEYGWIPNTGLGTMLNYYDRVVHDRRNEKDGSEWRSKIGKLLMDGYNGGSIIPTAIPLKVMECDAANAVQIKLELS